ncbi:MAG: MBL fold metallo-hydrolase, partial [Pseudomonadota bacterium]
RAAAGEALRFLPGHGPEVTDPGALLAGQLAHRRARRDALVAALAEGPASAPLLAARLYVGTPPSLLPAASRNVLATLLQLQAEGVAAPDGPLSSGVRFRLV